MEWAKAEIQFRFDHFYSAPFGIGINDLGCKKTSPAIYQDNFIALLQSQYPDTMFGLRFIEGVAVASNIGSIKNMHK